LATDFVNKINDILPGFDIPVFSSYFAYGLIIPAMHMRSADYALAKCLSVPDRPSVTCHTPEWQTNSKSCMIYRTAPYSAIDDI